jgi:hypothetical protein
MIALHEVPDGRQEIIRVYGDPLAQDFIQRQLMSFELPFVAKASWDLSLRYRWLTMHRYVGDAVVDALLEIMQHRGLDYLVENAYDVTGGTFNLRKKTGSSQLSTHAWGISIDWCPHLGQFGRHSQVPDFIVRAFERRGFIWGGRWKLPDGMHFQACRGY